MTTRIALAGAHETGKSTLAAELARALHGHRVVEEPYYALEARGTCFAAPPTLEDFEAQLERSLRDVREARGDVIFDRSPADYLAYMLAHREAAHADVSSWLPRVADAVATLDLTVFVPIERPDRISAEREAGRLRRRVHATLRAALVGDEWGFGANVLEVAGTPGERTRQVLARLAAIESDVHAAPL